MSNKYERSWYKNPIVVIPLIAAIIGAAGVITAAFIQRSPSEPQGSDIKIVAVDQDRLGPGLIEVTDTSTGEIIYCSGIVEYLDFRIKNNGDEVALIHQLTVEVLNYSILEGYMMPPGILESSLDYCIKLETIKATPYMINKSPNIFVKPGDFDRFRLFFYSDVYARYNVTIKLYYDGKEEE